MGRKDKTKKFDSLNENSPPVLKLVDKEVKKQYIPVPPSGELDITEARCSELFSFSSKFYHPIGFFDEEEKLLRLKSAVTMKISWSDGGTGTGDYEIRTSPLNGIYWFQQFIPRIYGNFSLTFSCPDVPGTEETDLNREYIVTDGKQSRTGTTGATAASPRHKVDASAGDKLKKKNDTTGVEAVVESAKKRQRSSSISDEQPTASPIPERSSSRRKSVNVGISDEQPIVSPIPERSSSRRKSVETTADSAVIDRLNRDKVVPKATSSNVSTATTTMPVEMPKFHPTLTAPHAQPYDHLKKSNRLEAVLPAALWKIQGDSLSVILPNSIVLAWQKDNYISTAPPSEQSSGCGGNSSSKKQKAGKKTKAHISWLQSWHSNRRILMGPDELYQYSSSAATENVPYTAATLLHRGCVRQRISIGEDPNSAAAVLLAGEFQHWCRKLHSLFNMMFVDHLLYEEERLSYLTLAGGSNEEPSDSDELIDWASFASASFLLRFIFYLVTSLNVRAVVQPGEQEENDQSSSSAEQQPLTHQQQRAINRQIDQLQSILDTCVKEMDEYAYSLF